MSSITPVIHFCIGSLTHAFILFYLSDHCSCPWNLLPLQSHQITHLKHKTSHIFGILNPLLSLKHHVSCFRMLYSFLFFPQVEPDIEHHDLVHHMLLYRCPAFVNRAYDGPCYRGDMGDMCFSVVAVWGIGGRVRDLQMVLFVVLLSRAPSFPSSGLPVSGWHWNSHRRRGPWCVL